MKKLSREALTAYYREAGSWASDRLESLERSQRTAWIVAAGAAAVAIAEAIALFVLMPLKTVEPYTLLVDRTTGFVQALRPLETSQITPDQALVQSMLVQYVIARENFDSATLQANYRKVGLWSAERARTDYVDLMQASNPESPLVVYPGSTLVETRVKSVSPLTPNSVLVRFETARRDQGDRYQPRQPWVAVVQYRFSGAPMSTDDRYLNPLGFQVVEYRKDPETVAPPPVTTYGALPAEDALVEAEPGSVDGEAP
jgi:type IV secretion system protein VirB8